MILDVIAATTVVNDKNIFANKTIQNPPIYFFIVFIQLLYLCT